MDREQVLARLDQCSAEMKAQGVRSLYMFGSTARGTARVESDIDLFIETDPDSRFNAFDLVELKALLEQRLETRVDLSTRDGLHPRLRDDIEGQAIRVF